MVVSCLVGAENQTPGSQEKQPVLLTAALHVQMFLLTQDYLFGYQLLHFVPATKNETQGGDIEAVRLYGC